LPIYKYFSVENFFEVLLGYFLETKGDLDPILIIILYKSSIEILSSFEAIQMLQNHYSSEILVNLAKFGLKSTYWSNCATLSSGFEIRVIIPVS